MNGDGSIEGVSILHVLSSGAVGGIQRLVADLSAEQERRGAAVSVAFLRAEGDFVDIFARRGVRTIDLGLTSARDMHPRRLSGAARRLVASADIIHLHDFSPALMALAMLARSRPRVFTEHIPLEITGMLRRAAQRAFLGCCCERIVAVSEHTKRVMVEIFRLAPDRVSVVHNGLTFDSRSTQHSSAAEASAPLRVGYVGRLDVWKQPRLIVEALHHMDRSSDVRVVMIGEGPQREELERIASDLRVSDRISFLGFRSDVDRCYEEMDVLVHPSRAEPFGLVIVEAASHGVFPIVHVDGGGALEAIPPGAGVIANARELASLLDELIGSPRLGPEERDRRAAWARGAFPISATADAYLDIYLRMMGRRSEAPVQS